MKSDAIFNLIKYFLTLFTLILVPTYWYYYGVQNFLWLSDIGLFLTVMSLWLHSAMLMSIAAVAVLVIELVWNIDFFGELIFNVNIIDLADYMFDPSYPFFLRILSLFHVITPLVWIWYLKRYGYDTRALRFSTILYWVDVWIVFLFTEPIKNINWVFLPQVNGTHGISPVVWVLFLCVAFPLFIFLPTHYIFKKIFKST